MQILNAIADPINAMTVSNEGTRIARRTIVARVEARIAMRMISVMYLDDLAE